LLVLVRLGAAHAQLAAAFGAKSVVIVNDEGEGEQLHDRIQNL
jgi:hypothetical protein